MHGGQQPVAGARIALYVAGAGSNGAGAVDLLAGANLRTGADGTFSVTGRYVCPAASAQVYVVARGGNPGLAAGTDNPALVLMAALGNCGDLTPSTSVFIDEVTTVAAAWALAPFFGADASIGSSASNATGLRNAFRNTGTLANRLTGTAPGAALPNGVTVEAPKIHALANALAPCVNSDGGGTPCAALFSASTAAGVRPGNTLDAALSIVRHPAANVADVFALSSAQPPFLPTLSTAPADWTLSATYGLCTAHCGNLDLPGLLALDSTGSAWVANYFGGVVTKFSPVGEAVAPDGYPGLGLRQSFGVAIDPLDNVWVANETSVAGTNNSGLGSVSKFTPAGVELSGYGYTGGGVYYPQGMASDAGGNIWVADYGDSSATLLRNNGTAVSPAAGYAASNLPFTSAVGLDAGGNAWFAVQGGSARVTPAGTAARFGCCNGPQGVSLDAAGNIWLADYGAASIVEQAVDGTVLARIADPTGNTAAQAIAVDSAGKVWAANFRGNSLVEIDSLTGTRLSPAAGLGRDAALSGPIGLAVDASGNLWLSNLDSSTVTVFFGLASPVRTPLSGPATAP